MKYVVKRPIPADFTAFIAQDKPSNWDNDFPSSPMPEAKREENITYYSKAELRTYLLEEQGYLCCYCNKLLSDDGRDTAIEHIAPKEGTRHQHRIFDYHNLSVSCKGGERDPKPRKLHCDAEKGIKDIPLTHLQASCETEISFNIEGKIIANSTNAEETIKKLNLDLPKLNNLRQSAIAAYIYADKDETEYIPIEEAQVHIQTLSSLDENGKYKPYVSAIIAALQSLIT